jgi:hypothetical protein
VVSYTPRSLYDREKTHWTGRCAEINGCTEQAVAERLKMVTMLKGVLAGRCEHGIETQLISACWLFKDADSIETMWRLMVGQLMNEMPEEIWENPTVA